MSFFRRAPIAQTDAYDSKVPEAHLGSFLKQLRQSKELDQFAKITSKGIFIRLNKLVTTFLNLNKLIPESPRDYIEYMEESLEGFILETQARSYLSLTSGTKAKVIGMWLDKEGDHPFIHTLIEVLQ